MFRSPLFPIFLTVLVDVMALTLVMPLLPYYAQHFGASPVVVTALMASFSAGDTVTIDVGPDGTLTIEREAPSPKRQPAKAGR